MLTERLGIWQSIWVPSNCWGRAVLKSTTHRSGVYRYVSDVCIPDDANPEPKWDPHTYLSTTWPGSRAPHVLLKDGKSIFDLLGSDFSLVEFRDGHGQQTGCDFMATAAMGPGVLLVPVTLVGGTEAVSICEKNLGLVRSDGHVAWRGASVKDQGEADRILETVLVVVLE
ncbi:FAD-binding domain-containing protein [Fusarium pseudocircinatum]|uniref:FAD-binding domain-containing protein n=1 Tax=Fusarium pseudocircinatum TaxID=56676 RepID=A0A8H5KRD3_9HYPO|nr:FAD-binding domain-containing protein [Fusarium pseudocircinatum]